MDLLLEDSIKGGKLTLENGDIKTDNTLFTAVYLSLFNGDCFYNIYEKYKTTGDFQESLNLPITKQNLDRVEQCGKNALLWLINEGIAKSVDIFAYGDKNNKINADITIREPDDVNYLFSIIWANERAVLINGKLH